MEQQTPLQRAIEVAGGVAALARAIGVKSQAISQWDDIPLSRVPAVSRVTGIPKGELRSEYAEDAA